jgi:hypothetical protein
MGLLPGAYGAVSGTGFRVVIAEMIAEPNKIVMMI